MLLHFLLPLLVAVLLFRDRWQWAFLVMVLTMTVDLDHLLATPIYDAQRCSIGFHPLHGGVPIALYGLLCWPKSTRLLGLGLLIHMLLDAIDCQMTCGVWYSVGGVFDSAYF